MADEDRGRNRDSIGSLPKDLPRKSVDVARKSKDLPGRSAAERPTVSVPELPVGGVQSPSSPRSNSNPMNTRSTSNPINIRSNSNPMSPAGRSSMSRGRPSLQIERPEEHDWDQRHRAELPSAVASGPHRQSKDLHRPSKDLYRPSMQSRRHSSMQSPAPPTVHEDSALSPEPVEHGEGDQPPPSVETMQSGDPAFAAEPPSLNYTLRTRKLSILFFWSLIIFDSVAMPLLLYFTLWYLTDLSPNVVFSIVTAALGGISIFEYVLRFWRLFKKSSNCRVIGARRMYLDWFHWNFTLAWVIIMLELIIGTIPANPPIRLLAMPVTSLMYAFGVEILVIDILAFFKVPAPCRISSIPKGAQLRPGIYSIIEDVCAVDGSGGTEFREALNTRYEASHVFRVMLKRLDIFWSIGANGMAVVTTILVFTLGHDAAYVVGWAAPFVWAGIWVTCTFWYVFRMLKEERRVWAEEAAKVPA